MQAMADKGRSRQSSIAQGSSHSSIRSLPVLGGNQALHQLLLHDTQMRISHSLFLQGHLFKGGWQELSCQAPAPLRSGHFGVFGGMSPPKSLPRDMKGRFSLNGWIITSSFISEGWGVLAECDPSVTFFLPVGIGCSRLSLQMEHWDWDPCCARPSPSKAEDLHLVKLHLGV